MSKVTPIDPICRSSSFYDLCRHIWDGKTLHIKKKRRTHCIKCGKENEGKMQDSYCSVCLKSIAKYGALAARKPAHIQYDDERFAGWK